MTDRNLKEIAHKFDDTCSQLQFLLHTFRTIELAAAENIIEELEQALYHPMRIFDELTEQLLQEVEELFELYHGSDDAEGVA